MVEIKYSILFFSNGEQFWAIHFLDDIYSINIVTGLYTYVLYFLTFFVCTVQGVAAALGHQQVHQEADTALGHQQQRARRLHIQGPGQ